MTDSMRLSTAEREAASARLADHFAEGRLDHDEYAERLDRIWAAKVRRDLTPIFRDLPGSSPAPGAVRTRGRPRPSERRPRLPFPVVALIALVVGALVLTHLPVALLVLGVWFFLLRGRCGPAWGHRRW